VFACKHNQHYKVTFLFSNPLRCFTDENCFSLDEYDPIGIVDIGKSEKPRSIAIHPIRRLLFWTDVGSQQSVVRAKMDGSSSMILADHLEGVTSLGLDPISNIVFFAHGKKIEYIDINGKNR
jgi:low density lipoprotein receptor-related protein 5/6